jgi:hypothetical protein
MLNVSSNIEFGTGLVLKNENKSDNIEDYTVIVSYGIEDCCGFVNEYKLSDILYREGEVISS